MGLKLAPAALEAFSRASPQSNQRGIETSRNWDDLNILTGLNRTSVGLKRWKTYQTENLHDVPQSNQRGIETQTWSDVLGVIG